MSNCLRCGSELKPGDKYCDKCGALNIQPVKRARWNWLPWIGVLFAAVSVLYFGGMTVFFKYKEQTGQFDNARQSRVEENVDITSRNLRITNKLTGEKIRFRYPKVTITSYPDTYRKRGKRTTRISEIDKDIGKYCEGEKYGRYAADYSYYINNKILSIIVEVRRVDETPRTDYFVYNIYVGTGTVIEADNLIRDDYKTSDDNFFEMAEKTFISCFEAGDLTEKEKDKLLGQLSYTFLEPYIGEGGHLCFAAEIEKEDGSHEMAIFDAEDQKRLTGPLDSRS